MTLAKFITLTYSVSIPAQIILRSFTLLVLRISVSFFFMLKIDFKVNSLLKTLNFISFDFLEI